MLAAFSACLLELGSRYLSRCRSTWPTPKVLDERARSRAYVSLPALWLETSRGRIGLIEANGDDFAFANRSVFGTTAHEIPQAANCVVGVVGRGLRAADRSVGTELLAI